MKTQLTLWIDAELKAKTKSRVGNLSAYVNTIFQQVVDDPKLNPNSTIKQLKEESDVLRAQLAEKDLMLKKKKEEEDEHAKKTRRI
tara:strand:- start:1687 stop:1944 length:258 start_codon:yes stop_codon:yes gene_type:complete